MFSYTRSYSGNSYVNYWHRIHDDLGLINVNTEGLACPDTYTIVGVKAPEYKSIISAGQDATFPYSRISTKLASYSPIMVEGERFRVGSGGVYHQTLKGSIINCYTPTAALNDDISVVDNTAKMAFVAKVIKTQRSLAGGVVLGELRKTIQMIIRPASSLRRQLSRYLERSKKNARAARYKRGRIRPMTDRNTRKDVQAAVAGSWLEGVFGWGPLISDVQDGAKALARIVNDGFKIQRVSHFTQFSSETPKGERPVAGYAGWFGAYANSREEVALRVSYFGGVVVETPKLSIPQILGLTWSDLPATIWELIPGSFLLDYFANVQELIDSLRVLNVGFTFLGRSEKRLASGYSSFSRVDPAVDIPNVYTGTRFSGYGGETRVDKLIFTRTGIQKAVLIPNFQVNLPGLKQNFNIAALIAQSAAATRYVVR